MSCIVVEQSGAEQARTDVGISLLASHTAPSHQTDKKFLLPILEEQNNNPLDE